MLGHTQSHVDGLIANLAGISDSDNNTKRAERITVKVKVENCDTTTNRSTGTERRGHYRQVVNAGEAYNIAQGVKELNIYWPGHGGHVQPVRPVYHVSFFVIFYNMMKYW